MTLIGKAPDQPSTELLHQQLAKHRAEAEKNEGFAQYQERDQENSINTALHLAMTTGEKPSLTEGEKRLLNSRYEAAQKSGNGAEIAKYAGQLNILGDKPPYGDGEPEVQAMQD